VAGTAHPAFRSTCPTPNAGLQITPRLAGLPAGDRGFHVHVNPICGPGNGPNGQPAAGMADHYDPANTGKHRGPLGKGHKGDLPVQGHEGRRGAAPSCGRRQGPLDHDPRRRR
jgi:Cu/Zn superoxide dismutase